MNWRVGRTIPINVYEGDRPVCQCHNEDDARRIVAAMNRSSSIPCVIPTINLLDLEVSVRLYNCLRNIDTETAHELLERSARGIKNFGAGTFAEVTSLMVANGIAPSAILASEFWRSAPLLFKRTALQGTPQLEENA